MYGVFGEESLRFFIGDGGVDNHVVALLPVDRSGNAILVTNLESYEIDSGVSGINRRDNKH